MAWVAVDKKGWEDIYTHKPYRDNICGFDMWITDYESVELPKGSIKKLIGKELTWNDEPVELK